MQICYNLDSHMMTSVMVKDCVVYLLRPKRLLKAISVLKL